MDLRPVSNDHKLYAAYKYALTLNLMHTTVQQQVTYVGTPSKHMRLEHAPKPLAPLVNELSTKKPGILSSL